MPHSPTIALAQQLLRRESITPQDAGCQAILRARLSQAGFACEAMNFADVSNLWATHGAAKPLLVFAGHTDVVPTGPRQQWQIPPFDGAVRDGMLHGRGAADMKGSVASFVTACERFVARRPRHAGAIGLLITSDEEGPARHGTREVMRALAARGQRIDFCLVGEPSSAATLGDTIKVGRRGSLGATLRIRGVQGHIAYPLRNPIHDAAEVIAELLAVEWDAGDADFPPTSFQVSNIHAGTGVGNVIPGETTLQFNLRYAPQSTAAALQKRIEAVLARRKIDYDIEWNLSGEPFATAGGALLDAVSNSVAAATGAAPVRSTAGGTSDGRFIAPHGAQVVELGPVNATIHQIDECVSVADLEQLSRIYEDILECLL